MTEAPELRFVSYRHGRLAYREAGAGRALLFLHGMNGNSKSWAFAFQALSPSFRVVAWDAPSCGRSDSFGDSLEDYVAAVKALIRSLELQDVVVIGHSMGGLVATSLAAEPDMPVTGLILSSTHLGFSLPPGRPLMPRYATRIERLTAKGSSLEYGLLFGLVASALVIFGQLNNMLLNRLGPRQIMTVALPLFAVATGLFFAVSGSTIIWMIVPPLWLTIGLVGLLTANAMSIAMEGSEGYAGLGSAGIGAVQFGLAFSVSSLVALAGTDFASILLIRRVLILICLFNI